MQNPSYETSRSRGRGQQGELEQLPDGRWRARYREQGRDGKRPQKTFPENQKRQASQWLRDGLAEAQRLLDGDTCTVVGRRESERTVAEACQDYLAAVDGIGPGREKVLRQHLSLFCKTFGPRRLQSLEPYELQAWRKTVSPGYRAFVFKSVKQMLRQATVWHWLPTNPADGIKNPAPSRPEVTPLPWEKLRALEDEIVVEYEGLPTFMAATGLRPEEWIPLERADIDLANRLVHVRRVYTNGELKKLVPRQKGESKSALQYRSVPLRQVVLDALAKRPPRIDTQLLWPSPSGGYLDLGKFRETVWSSTFRAAGIGYQRPYDARHTYATDSIAATIDTFTLSRRMGTSVREIDATYGHLYKDAADRELELLDAWDAKQAEAK